HDGRHDVDLRTDNAAALAELVLQAWRDHQHRDVEATQVHLGDLLVVTEAMVAHDHEQRVLVGLQQGIERTALGFAGFQLLRATVEHVLVGHAPRRIGEHRVNEIVAADEVGHALVAEETGLVREAGHGGEHALVGVRAVGEEVIEQQTFFGQLVEVRRDVGLIAQRTDRVTGEAFHQDDHDVLDRQRVAGGRRELATHCGAVGIDQLVVGG
nr:hypothetical protein [Tanacetum cinerariifolium]